MEIREVKIEEYWPLIVKNTVEFGQIAAAENPEFNRLAKCIYQVLQESFVHDATEYGVKRWESILGINPASGATLDDRKATILTYLSVKVPYTWRVLKQMLVPVLGGEDKFVMEYFNHENKLVLHTDRLNDTMLATVSDLLERVLPQNIEVARYNHRLDVSWREICPLLPMEKVGKYDECRTLADVKAVDANYINDLCGDGIWACLLSNLRDTTTAKNYSSDGLFRGKSKIKTFWLKEMPELTKCYGFFKESGITSLKLSLPKAIELGNYCYGHQMGFCSNNTKLEYLELDIPSAENVQSLCYGCNKVSKISLTSAHKVLYFSGGCCNCPKLTSFSIDSENTIHSAKDAWNNCLLNKTSVLCIVRALAENPTKKLTSDAPGITTLGIHVDHKTDEEVLAAIANAEAKGWTLTVQWNGTPTSGISTTDLEEIWCKVTECEYGEYTDENGNRCTLDWGHYVTDSSEYKLFYSLVEAEQYFKLTKVNENE